MVVRPRSSVVDSVFDVRNPSQRPSTSAAPSLRDAGITLCANIAGTGRRKHRATTRGCQRTTLHEVLVQQAHSILHQALPVSAKRGTATPLSPYASESRSCRIRALSLIA